MIHSYTIVWVYPSYVFCTVKVGVGVVEGQMRFDKKALLLYVYMFKLYFVWGCVCMSMHLVIFLGGLILLLFKKLRKVSFGDKL